MGYDELGDMGHGTFSAYEERGLIGAHAPPIKKLLSTIRQS
jgi:hypothetical protein